jgi:hypothetical protein
MCGCVRWGAVRAGLLRRDIRHEETHKQFSAYEIQALDSLHVLRVMPATAWCSDVLCCAVHQHTYLLRSPIPPVFTHSFSTDRTHE